MLRLWRSSGAIFMPGCASVCLFICLLDRYKQRVHIDFWPFYILLLLVLKGGTSAIPGVLGGREPSI